jgi:transcriptional regulator with XRE-family HTH domain
MANPDLHTLGQRIRTRRKALGWSQEAFAAQAGVDRSYMGGIERGERNITFSVLCTICGTLGCDMAALTGGLPAASGQASAQEKKKG